MEPLPVHSKWSSNLAKKSKNFGQNCSGWFSSFFFKFRVLLSDPEKKKLISPFMLIPLFKKKYYFLAK